MADQQQIDELFTKLEEERERLLEQARALSEAEASRVPKTDVQGEAEWTAKEQWAHMAESEANYRAWIVAALRSSEPDVSETRREPVTISLAQAKDARAEELIAQLAAERGKTLSVLRAMTPEQFDRKATHRMFGTLTVLQFARSAYRHDRMHLDQIAGREPSYRPNFADGQEPDQRLRTNLPIDR